MKQLLIGYNSDTSERLMSNLPGRFFIALGPTPTWKHIHSDLTVQRSTKHTETNKYTGYFPTLSETIRVAREFVKLNPGFTIINSINEW